LRATLDLLVGPNPPTAIVAGNDVLAMQALSAATMAGLRVPEDISVVGHDDISLAQLVSPKLTTVAQPAYSMGATAARLLTERLADPSLAPREELLPPRLVVRESTSKCLLERPPRPKARDRA
jgi:DNA-binding LacI/PurR family transcriptional regulator